MDQAIEKALERKAQLQAELDRLETFIAVHHELMGGISTSVTRTYNIGGAQVTTVVASPTTSAARSYRDGELAVGKRQLIEDTAAKVLALKGPLGTAQLLEEFRLLNVSVGGADESTNLASYLSKSGRFANNRKEGWSLIVDGAPVRGTEKGAGKDVRVQGEHRGNTDPWAQKNDPKAAFWTGVEKK